MMRVLVLLLALSGVTLQAQTAPPAAALTQEASADAKPLPAMQLLLPQVERNLKTAEAMQASYTYHVHSEEQELDNSGKVKKTTVVDAESLAIDGVRVNRVVARDGKPLTTEQARKEDERIDREVAKGRERRAKAAGKGEDTNARGDTIISASRIMELGTFTNPRRVLLEGRSTIVADYAGDKNAKTRNSAEGIIKDLVGTVWIDEEDKTVAKSEGHFLNDFKIGGGLVADIHKGTNFQARFTKVNGEVWLPVEISGEGSARILLFTKLNGRLRLATSEYRKFRTGVTIRPGNGVIGEDGKIVPDDAASSSPGNPPH